MTINDWLRGASNELADAMFTSARLDAEIILAHTINHPRTWLHAHGDEELPARQEEIAHSRLDLRLDYVPVAYIIGHNEFYGRRFRVDTHTLIPRPESEQLIELLCEATAADDTRRLVDIGTGSGCLAITAKLERPSLSVIGTDTSKQALKVAELNALALKADVQFLESDLLTSYPFRPTIIMANLPYVDQSWERSRETAHEPAEALFAAQHGLKLISQLIDQAAHRQQTHNILLLEADPRQWSTITTLATAAGYQQLAERPFARSFVKV